MLDSRMVKNPKGGGDVSSEVDTLTESSFGTHPNPKVLNHKTKGSFSSNISGKHFGNTSGIGLE